MSVRISNIQRFCLHDGPGIRTTVFLKGCNLHCPWCANPETLLYKKQYYFDKEKCIATDGVCSVNSDCPMLSGGLNNITKEDMIACICNAIGQYGYDISLDELERELLKDKVFFEESGGITFSGGEPLLQIEKYEPLLKRLKEKEIHLCAETALFVPRKLVEIAAKYIDLFIVDVKILDAEKCKNILGGDVEVYKANIELIGYKEILFRFPVVESLTLNNLNIEAICEFISSRINTEMEIFSMHSLANKKYEVLGIKNKLCRGVSDIELESVKKRFSDYSIDAQIVKL